MITVEIKAGTSHCQYKRGDIVKIFYDKTQLDYSYIDGYKEDTVASVGCMILGSIAVMSGLLVGFVVWRG